MSDLSISAYSGMSRASASFDHAAGRMTQAAGGGYSAPSDSVDLSAAAVGMIQTSDQFQLTLAMVDIANQMDATMLSLLG